MSKATYAGHMDIHFSRPDYIKSALADLAAHLNAIVQTKIDILYLLSSLPKSRKTDTDDKTHLQSYGIVYTGYSEDSGILLESHNLPKLELMTEIKGIRKAKYIKESILITDVYCWSNSQIILRWIMSEKLLNRFVQNEVVMTKL